MDVLHLHHLTPINEAAARVAPDVPVVGHLHGTELLMLEAIEDDPGRWAHGPAWAERLRGWAARCERLIVLSDNQVARAERLLGVDPARCVRVANGFDPDTFTPRHVDHRALWRRALVEEPRGWAPGEEAGSVRYEEADLVAFGDDRGETPVLLYVGRYTEVKRLPLLIEAYAQAAPRFDRRAPLVLVGGFPGEWEGEHPLEAIRRTGARDVFLAGWHDHAELPDLPRRLGHRRAAVGARAVRPGAGRGRGVRAAVDRRRRPRAGRRSSATARPAGSCRPTTAGARGRARGGRQRPGRAPSPRRAGGRGRAREVLLAGARRAGRRCLRGRAG